MSVTVSRRTEIDGCAQLVAACDVLVLRALELLGKRIVRDDRSRYGRLNGRPWHEAHCLWQPDLAMEDRALRGAWSMVPELLSRYPCGDVRPAELTAVLDRYVRELVRSHRAHDGFELAYRLDAWM